jgi:hypothetical protein
MMRMAPSPMGHFEKLRDYDMMKNFMALGSLTQGMEVDEVTTMLAYIALDF